MQTVILGAVVVVVAMYLYLAYRPSRQYLLSGHADEERWGRLYAGEDPAAVREALAAITWAFLLRAADSARLLPTDRLMDVYRAAYPASGTPDALESETLWKRMRESLSASEDELRDLTGMTVQDVVAMWLDKSRGRRTSAKLTALSAPTRGNLRRRHRRDSPA